ncbi:hypothetical protein ABZV38_39185, partial [Streptomyces sp. NPDC005181]
MRIKNVSIVLAGSAVMATLASSPAAAATSSLPDPSVTAVLNMQKQAMANGAPGALTRIDSGTSSYRISIVCCCSRFSLRSRWSSSFSAVVSAPGTPSP